MVISPQIGQASQPPVVTPRQTVAPIPRPIDWFQGQPKIKDRTPLGRLVLQGIAALFRDHNEEINPLTAPGDTPVMDLPPPVLSVMEGIERMGQIGWETRVGALRRWSDAALKDLPNSKKALDQILFDIQALRARLAIHLEEGGILPLMVPTDHEPLAKAALEYERARTGLGMMAQEADFVIQRLSWQELQDPTVLSPLTDEDLAARGYSPLAPKILSTYDASGKRAPAQALPEGTLVYILTNNPILKGTSEAQKALEAAQRYYAGGQEPLPPEDQTSPQEAEQFLQMKGTYDTRVQDYAKAMRALLKDGTRAKAFLVDLSLIHTAQALLLQDPDGLVERLLSDPKIRDVLFAPEDTVGRKTVDSLIRARDDLAKAQRSGKRVHIARAKQIHDNILSVLVFHYGPQLTPYLLQHPKYAGLDPSRLDNLQKATRDKDVARYEFEQGEQVRLEKLTGPANRFMTLTRTGLADQYQAVFDYLITVATESMDQVRDQHPETYKIYKEPFRKALNNARQAIEKFWNNAQYGEMARREHDRLVLDPAGPRDSHPKEFNGLAYNRLLEALLKSLLGTGSKPWSYSQAKRNSKGELDPHPGLLEVVQDAMATAGSKTRLNPPIPLFATFASNFRPLTRAKKKEVGFKNPLYALLNLTGTVLVDLLSGEFRDDGTDYGDYHLMSWATTYGTEFHDNAVVMNAGVAGALSVFNSPLINMKHTSWGSDFNSLLSIAGALSPKRGDPLRMRAVRIMAKADLSSSIPVWGIGQKRLTIAVPTHGYRAVEIRAAQTLAFGDIFHDLQEVASFKDSRDFSRASVPSRTGQRSVGLFSELTMPVMDHFHLFDPTREGVLGIAPSSAPLMPTRRGTSIALMAEAISGKPQAILWPMAGNSFATFPKPDKIARLERAKGVTIVPSLLFNGALPGSNGIAHQDLDTFYHWVGNLQSLQWIVSASMPELIRPVPQDAELRRGQ